MDLSTAINLVVEQLSGWLNTFIKAIPNITVALLVFIVFWFFSSLAGRFVRRAAGVVTSNKQIITLLSRLASIAVLFAGLMISLGILGASNVVTSFLAGAGVIGLALGFAFQDIAENFIAGIMLAIRRPFKLGDLIETNDYFGIVQNVSLRTTIVQTLQGIDVHIPNGTIYSNPIVNYTETPGRRVDMVCGIAYDDDMRQARSVAIEALQDIVYRDQSRDVELFFNEFGNSSINFVLRFWITESMQGKYLEAQSEAAIKLKKAFDDSGINIPFPIRTLELGSSEKKMLETFSSQLGQLSKDESRGADEMTST